MPRKTRQQLHLQEARDIKKKGPSSPICKVDKRNFVIATLASGTTYTQQTKAFELCNREFSKERYFPIVLKSASTSM